LSLDRRTLLGIGIASPLAGAPALAQPMPIGNFGIDAAHFGVRPNTSDDQTAALQRALEAASATRAPLYLAPGVYPVADVTLPAGAQLYGVRGATCLSLTYGASIVAASGADGITLSGLVFDGALRPLPDRRGLVTMREARGLKITDCMVHASGGAGIWLEAVDGEVTHTSVIEAAKTAIFSIDARGLSIVGNTVKNAGNNGIQVWRSQAGDDGTIVTGNRIDNIKARDGGSGQNGNGVNVFRAGNVTVADNRISNCAFSAVRGNAASNLHIRGNSTSKLGEVALYSEFGFEGAIIAHNTVDGAALGVSITNFNEGGRLAVCQGNLVRNLFLRGDPKIDPESRGVGIAVEADTAVTGNVVEGAPVAGIWVGWKQHLRDVTVTGNVVRGSPIGVAVSVSPGAGSAIVADNLISGATQGAVVGMDGLKAVTGDLSAENSPRHAQLTISNNRAR
jgi:uncharacterized secreted repeat protein (TIGR03808 family)